MTENLNQNNNEIINEDVNETKPFTWWERLKYVFTNPVKLFDNLREYPKVLFPILLVSIGMMLLILLRLDSYREFLSSKMMEQLAKQGTEVPNLEGLVNTQVYISVIAMAVTPIVVWVFKSFLTNGLASVFGGDGKFKNAFSVISHAFIPVLLGQVIVTIISLIIGKFEVLINFAVLLPESMTGGLLYSILSQIDIFIIWYQILAIIGISQVYGIPRKKSTLAVLLPWITWLLIIGGLSTLKAPM
ncbi:Yip1 family protein [Caloranaerobacter ferrireducens]|uniref:Yip1 family protein n=1 Tax=Caloranaerobacter ferrireducens TaxID=1323370 RepID=UPI00084DBF9C|nr:Yip1 family protein [Caloranaerobacter ferrireducens]